LYFDGTGQINQIVGGYDDVDDYLALKEAQRQSMADSAQQKTKQVKQGKQSTHKPVVAELTAKKKKLSFKDARELELLPEKIDELENLIDSIQEKVNDADFFSQDDKITKKVLNQLAEAESNLEIVYARWQELDDE
jgi:ATP-binding cassette subfamily F protein uup